MASINVEKIKKEAQELFSSGSSCSEAVVKAIRSNIDPNMPQAIVNAATAFSGGVGRSSCMCGTVSGSVLCLGYFFGRGYPTTVTDPKSTKTLALAHELQQAFKDKHKVLCCHAHKKMAEKAGIELKTQCIQYVGDMAEKTAQILARELV